MTDLDEEAKLDNAAAFGKWFAGAFLSLRDHLADTNSADERRAATEVYMANRGIAWAAWQAGREQQWEEIGVILQEVFAGIRETCREEDSDEAWRRLGTQLGIELHKRFERLREQ